MGLVIAGSRGYTVQTLTFGQVGETDPTSMKQHALLGLGMLLAVMTYFKVLYATVVADAFCHNMVRALVGALLAVG